MDITEPKITREAILFISDPHFHPRNVCIVTGAGTGIDRATILAAAVHKLMTVGLDINEAEGKKTQQMARDMDGQMIFIQSDLTRDQDIEHAVQEAAKLGNIKYLANVAGIQHIDSIENFPMTKYDLMQRIMLRAPFYLSKLVIPLMKKSCDGTGVIGNMASIHAHISTKKQTRL
jgi:3-hydroxybutyrate dehydrogenase